MQRTIRPKTLSEESNLCNYFEDTDKLVYLLNNVPKYLLKALSLMFPLVILHLHAYLGARETSLYKLEPRFDANFGLSTHLLRLF